MFTKTPRLLRHKSDTTVNHSTDHLFSTSWVSGFRREVLSLTVHGEVTCHACFVYEVESTCLSFHRYFKWQNWVMNSGLGDCKASVLVIIQ